MTKIKVLYEDSDILAIDKPSGISVHGDGKTKEKTVTDWILKNYPEMKNIGEPIADIPRPGIVHRLDRNTSGVLLLAKNQKTHQFLKRQFQNRTIKKTYLAIVEGWMKEDKGVINKPIGRSPSDFRRWLAGRGARGVLREAVTEYKVLKRFEAKTRSPYEGLAFVKRRQGLRKTDNQEGRFTILEIQPKTGRTHQIRVHMKFLNHPIVGDSLYNPTGAIPEGITRMALHAHFIEFKNLKGKTIKIESPAPLEFRKMIKS